MIGKFIFLGNGLMMLKGILRITFIENPEKMEYLLLFLSTFVVALMWEDMLFKNKESE